jgi:23S rRNA pseudouridine1911/1915/1917 synthase
MELIHKYGSFEFTAEESGERLDSFLASKLSEHSRTYIQKLAEEGLILVNKKSVLGKYKLKIGDNVKITIPEPVKLDIKAEKIPIEVIFEDNNLIIVNKPKGMVVHPAAGNNEGTLVNALLEYCGERLSDINGIIRPGIVHRIDKDTTGLLVVAKSNQAHEGLSKLLKQHDIKRQYIAIVEGVIRENSGIIDAPIGRHSVDRKKMSVNINDGRRAVTKFKVIKRFSKHTLVELQLETGRTHQIRVHMAFIKHPVMGDEVYGKKSVFKTDGQTLHAKTLGFVHPVTNEYLEFEAELPEYMKNILNELEKL